MDEHLLDTNILSKIFYGNVAVKNFVDNLNVGIETVVYIECIQGSISNTDKRRIKRSLQSLKFYSLENDVGQKAIELIET
jgi:predicted nucleic acid-binding protein